MHPGIIAFIVVYCLVLCTYFITETSGKLYLRAPNKIIMATMYLVFAFVFLFTNNIPYGLTIDSYFAIIIPAFFLIWLGDVFLLFDFNRGGDFFCAGNICFFVLELLLMLNFNVPVSSFWWIFLVVPIITGIFVFLFYKFPNIFKLGKTAIPFSLYLLSIILHGITGLALAIYLPQFLFLGLGSILFMLSDFVITLHRYVFPDSKLVLRMNSCLYFVGILLMVLFFAIPL